jgi:hypothetical protein
MLLLASFRQKKSLKKKMEKDVVFQTEFFSMKTGEHSGENGEKSGT